MQNDQATSWRQKKFHNLETMRKNILKIILTPLFIVVTSVVWGQSDYLITAPVQKNLGIAEQQRLNSVANQTTVLRNQIIQVNLDVIQSPTVSIQLFDGETIVVSKERANDQTGGFVWVGANHTKQERLILVVNGTDIIGTITSGTKIYGIRTIGENTQIMVEIDQSEYPSELCDQISSIQDTTAHSNSQDSEHTFSAFSHGGYECNLRLLVAYTSSSATASVNAGFGSIQNLILLAVEETNQSYINSGIDHRVELAHIVSVNYSESGNIQTDNDRFANQSDGHMDEIHFLRNLYTADVGVLMVGQGNGCGVAKTIHSDNNPNLGFCVVKYDCATGNYTFAHEIGHLQGARHDPYVDPSSTPFAYGHGFVKVSGEWRTIMAYNNECAANSTFCTRLQFWSNPHVNSPVDGTAMGTTATHHNSRVLNETTDKMKNYRVPSNDVYLDDITIDGLGYADVIAKSTINATNFTAQPGSVVRLRAGQQIVMGPDSHVEGDFIATIQPVTDCCTDHILPVVPSGASIPFEGCPNGGSQLCLGFNCADAFSVTITTLLGQTVHQGSGTVSDNTACIWNGSGVSSGVYNATVVANNSNGSSTFTYTIFLTIVSCKMDGGEEGDSEPEIRKDESPSYSDESLNDSGSLETEDHMTLIVYPNPVTNSATIEYSLIHDGHISIFITNAFGQEVLKVVDDKSYQRGRYKIVFDASSLSAGIYYYTLQVSDTAYSKKFILVK